MLNKLTITVGVVNIPVSIEKATSPGTKPSGKYVCAESALPVKTVGSGGSRSICEGKHNGECSRSIGYPRQDGSFFVPSENELDAMNGEKDRMIKLNTFVPSADVDPLYFNSTYSIKPEKGFEAAFWLLARRLAKANRIAVGSGTLDKDEVMIFLRWSARFDCLFLEIGIFDEQIKRSLIAGAQATEPQGEYARGMVKLADDLITNTFEEPFAPEAFKPTRWHRLRDLILANGASPTGEIAPVESSAKPTVDLMAQLQASVAQKKKEKASPKKAPTAGRKKVA